MSARESPRRRHSRYALPTVKVRLTATISVKPGSRAIADLTVDANLFKEAFIKAQQENEALFSKE